MFAGRVPDVGGPAVRLHPQQLLEVVLLSFGLQLRGPLGGGVHQSLLRRRHAPPGHRQLAAAISVSNDRSRVVREDAGHGRQVAGDVVGNGEKLPDGGLIFGHGVEIAHGPASLGRRIGVALLDLGELCF